MPSYKNREAFIPFSRNDIIQLCLQDGQLSAKDAEKFNNFCQILAAYYHFRFHQTLEVIKENYVPFNPNTHIQSLVPPTLDQYNEMEARVVEAFNHILERANYVPLSESSVQEALANKSLIDLKTEVDFNDFDQFICYYQGDFTQTITLKKLVFWKEQRDIEVFERIVILIKFKEPAYFLSQKVEIDKLKFIPGKMYVYFYKDVPQLDIDLLFPNVTTHMTWKDRLLFGIPAIGAAVPLVLKALPNLLLLIAAILLVLNARELIAALNIKPEQLRNVMPILVATLSFAMTLGGFAFKQYTTYKNKKIKFQKDVTDTLFFKNLANNDSAFGRLIDMAEEEECKEIILVYYNLLTSQKPLNSEQLDSAIETWMENKFGTTINFDINGPLSNLKEIHGRVMSNGGEISLLQCDSEGFCHVLPLDDAMEVLDYVWDNAFRYNGIDL